MIKQFYHYNRSDGIEKYKCKNFIGQSYYNIMKSCETCLNEKKKKIYKYINLPVVNYPTTLRNGHYKAIKQYICFEEKK